MSDEDDFLMSLWFN